MSSIASDLRRMADYVAKMRTRAAHGTDLNDELATVSANLHTIAQRIEGIVNAFEQDPRDSYVPPSFDPRD